MKVQLWFAACAASLALSGAPVLNPGGVTLDFSTLPPVSPGEGKGENLIAKGDFRDAKIAPDTWKLPNGIWGTNYWVHIVKADGDYRELMKKIAPFLKREIVSSQGQCFARIVSGMEAWKIKDDKNQDLAFSNQLLQRIILPADASGKDYVLSFRCRGKLETLNSKNKFRVFVRFRDDADFYKGKFLPYERTGEFKPYPEWNDSRIKITVPADAKLAEVVFLLYGPGEIDIADVSFRAEAVTGALAVDLYPQIVVDHRYRLGENIPNVLTFEVIDPGTVPRKNPRFEFVAPEGFEITDCQLPLLEKKTDNGRPRYIYSLDHWRFAKEYVFSYQINLMIRSALPAGDALYRASYRTVNNEVPGTWRNLDFHILPHISSPQPKRFVTGLFLGQQHQLPLPKSRENYANFYADCGFNFLESWFDLNGESGQIFKKRGVTRAVGPWGIADGYRFGVGPKPEDAKFRLADGTAYTEPGGQTFAICPAEVVERGPHFRAVAEQLIEKPIVLDDTIDTLMANHEPFRYNGKGCFCLRCRDRFLQYLEKQGGKVDSERFKTDWPGSAAAHANLWTRFCRDQHAEMVVAYEETARAAGKKAGKESHYIPEVNWAEFEDSSLPKFANYSAVAYMDKIPWIEPWGPYIFHNLNENYLYTPGIHLTSFAAGKVVRDFLKKNISDPKRIPKLIAFPHGIQSDGWITEPEAVSFETLCYFLNGWEGSVVYHFNNMDYIYYSELAKANSLIARYEDFVFDGREWTGDRAEALTPIIGPEEFRPWLNGDKLCAFLCLEQEKFAPYIGKGNALRLKSFQLGGKRLIAVGNFWQRGECFFNLQLENLDPEKRYVVRQPEAKRNFGIFTGTDLKQGIVLQVGALCWAFYEIEPAEAPDGSYGETISQAFVKAEMKKRLPEIKAAYAKERAVAGQWEKLHAAELDEEREATAGKRFEFGVLPNVASGKVNLTPAGQGAFAAIHVNAPDYSLKLQPAEGGIVSQWREASGVRLDTEEKGYGLTLDTILFPAANGFRLTRPMRVVEIVPTPEGVRVMLERKLSPGDCRALSGVTVTKCFLFRPDGFDVETVFRNDTKKEIELGYRMHNFAPVNRNVDGHSGIIQVSGKNFPRDLKHKLLRTGKPVPGLEKMLGMKPEQVTSGTMLFSAPWSPVKVMATPVNPEGLYGIFLWDAPGEAGMTAEYVYVPVKLKPNETLRVGAKWRLEK